MPKILPDIQNRILSIAESHFKEFGFDKTDMREIASEAKIAVGTIYLHYQNKEVLFLRVIAHSWDRTIAKCSSIIEQDFLPEEKLKQVLLEIVLEMTNRKMANSLWMEIGFLHQNRIGNLSDGDKLSEPHTRITKIIQSILLEMCKYKMHDSIMLESEQLASMAFIMTVSICMQTCNDGENRVNLIVELLKTYITRATFNSISSGNPPQNKNE
jgi:AcrR family transcriptional regulator